MHIDIYKSEDDLDQANDLQSKIESLEEEVKELQKMFDEAECKLHRVLWIAMDCGNKPAIMSSALQDIVNIASLGLTERWFIQLKDELKSRTVGRKTPSNLLDKNRANKIISFEKKYKTE